MNIDERIEALTQNLEVMSGLVRDLVKSVDELRESVDELRANSLRDSENIRALARIAEIHERRLTDLEEGQ